MSQRSALRPAPVSARAARAPFTFELSLGEGQHVAVCSCGWLSPTCDTLVGARVLASTHCHDARVTTPSVSA